MQSFVIEGGRPLSGTVRASGNKNGALPILAACTLATEEVRLSNVPRIRDVETMVELLADLGADVEWTGAERRPRRRRAAWARRISTPSSAREIRASFLLAGPLLARFGRVVGSAARAATSSGVGDSTRTSTRSPRSAPTCHRRRVRALRRTAFEARAMYLDEASVMGTENAIMAAVLAEGETVLGHAACEPHIQDLCRFLVSIGAEIEGIGSNVLHITGRPALGGGDYRIGPDHIEVASFVGLAAATGGDSS